MALAEQLDADYFICGAGAMGIAFIDSILTATDATVILVDKHAQPGGHWNDAYPFVRLHQPSKFYGVNSRKLERSTDPLELASRNEILSYYEAVIETYLASGRLQYFPMCLCEVLTSRTFHSLLDPSRCFKVCDHAKIVDATYMNVVVPSISDPQSSGRYKVEEGVALEPLNALTTLGAVYERYVIIGAGKTGMDAVLWLLNNEVDPDRIYWIMPRDSWIINRETFRSEFFDKVDLLSFMGVSKGIKSLADYFGMHEQIGAMQRIDLSVVPTQYKCATVSQSEMQQLRRIKNIVRLGRVERLECDKVVLTNGTLRTGPTTMHVDCSADGLATRPSRPVFAKDKITLQSIAMCQQVFSASLIGFLESRRGTDAEKNALCTPVPHPDTPIDGIKGTLQTTINEEAWKQDSGVAKWLRASRLYGLTSEENFMTGRQKAMLLFRSLPKLKMLLNAKKDRLDTLQRLSKL